MGKYSNEERRDKDFYPTPYKATIPLHEHIRGLTYCEPCAGDGRLIEHLKDIAECKTAYDISSRDPKTMYDEIVPIVDSNVFDLKIDDIHYIAGEDIRGNEIVSEVDCFITNPPWLNDKKHDFQLNRIILHLIEMKPCWLLLDGNYLFNKKSAQCMDFCTDVIPVGRVKWIEDSKYSGKENVAWFRFAKEGKNKNAELHVRK